MVSYPFIDQTIVANQSTQPNGSGIVVQNDSNTLDNANPPNANSTIVEKPKLYAGMAYVPGISEKIAATIKQKVPDLKIAPDQL